MYICLCECECVCVCVYQENLAVVLREKKKAIDIHCGPEAHGHFRFGKTKPFSPDGSGGARLCESPGPLARKPEDRPGSAGVESWEQTPPPRRGLTVSAAACGLCVWMQARDSGEGPHLS